MRLLLILLAMASPAAAQCFSHGGGYQFKSHYAPAYAAPYTAPYVAPVVKYDYVAPVVKQQDYVTQNYSYPLHVVYNVAFPPQAISGSTQYGYGADQYKFLDPALFMNAASRYMETGQLAAQKGFSEFSAASASILSQQAGIAEIQARSALLQEAAKLVASTAVGTSSAVRIQASRDASGALHLDSQPLAPVAAGTVGEIFSRKCSSCHNATKKEGGLDLTNLAVLDRKYEREILRRIVTDDASLRMPKGGKLSTDEIMTIIQASTSGSADVPPKASELPKPPTKQ